MNQIPLRLTRVLSYTPESFFIHSGVRELLENILFSISKEDFSCFYIYGGKYSGKTHIGILIASFAKDYQVYPYLVSGKEISSFIEEHSNYNLSDKDLVIFDSAEQYFNFITPGESGKFVNFYENLKNNRTKLLIFSSKSIDAFKCDEHIKSRLLGAAFGKLDFPCESELKKIIQLMGVQRGIKLEENNLEYLDKRLGKSFESINEYFERLIYLSENLGLKINKNLLSKAL